MPWEAQTTSQVCTHCHARGFKNVTMIHETFYTESKDGYKWYHHDEDGNLLPQPIKVEIKGVFRNYRSITEEKNGQKSVKLLSRMRCPHWRCKANDKIRQRNKRNAAKRGGN